MVSNVRRLVAFLVASISVAAAAEVQVAPRHYTVSDLDAIQQDEILLRAQAARAKQRAELNQYPGEAVGVRPAVPTSLPDVAWRRATASGWLGKFVLPGGASTIAGVGDALPGGYVVAEINAAGVKLRQGDEVFDLHPALSATPTTTRPLLNSGAQ